MGAAFVAFGIVLVLLVFFVATRDRRGAETGYALTDDFLALVPADIGPDKREEIRGILSRFERRVREGQVRPEDKAEIDTKVMHYIEAGDTISSPELHVLMALVSYYTHRLDPRYNPPDGSGVHPLIDDQNKDSTATKEPSIE